MGKPDSPAVDAGTAGTVAVGRAIGIRDVHDPIAARLLPPRLAGLAAAGRRVSTTPAGVLVDVATGGLVTHVTLRMVAVDAVLSDALGASPTAQVVVVGAGLDSRAWRLDVLRDREVYEVDRPRVQAVKRATADGLPTPARLRWVSADLAVDDLGEVLQAAGHDPGRPTVWLWEAVMPYLPPEASATTLAAMAGRSAPGTTLVVTWTRDDFRRTPVHRLVGAGVRTGFRIFGEPLPGLLTQDQLDAMLADTGWRATREAGLDEWEHRVPGAHAWADLFRVERLLVAVPAGGAGDPA